MSSRRSTALIALAATGLMVAGCASPAAPSGARVSPSGASTSSVAARTTRPAVTATPEDIASAPPEAAMICSAEVRKNIAKLLVLPKPPVGHATWANHLYSCSYNLPAGRLLLTVKESANDVAATNYLRGRQASYSQSRRITGLAALGLPAFENSTGTVAFVKDNFTLVVNARNLSGRLGHPGTTRSGFAYALATDVLACWSGG
jgi:hypothetical protein